MSALPVVPVEALEPAVVSVAASPACSFCDLPTAYVFVDAHTDHMPLQACRSHLVEAFEWVTS